MALGTVFALSVIRNRGRASAVVLQKELEIGYTAAQNLLHALEWEGWLGPERSDGSREIKESKETNVVDCARCGEAHPVQIRELTTQPGNDPPSRHWAMCPVLRQPIFVTVT